MYGAGAALSRLFCLVPEPTQFGRTRSRLRDGPRTSGAGAAQKSGSSGTLKLITSEVFLLLVLSLFISAFLRSEWWSGVRVTAPGSQWSRLTSTTFLTVMFQVRERRAVLWFQIPTSLNFDPDLEFWPNLDPDRGIPYVINF